MTDDEQPQAGPSRKSLLPQGKKFRMRKAGGEGKKGKIFLEDKQGLLALMNGITTDKDSEAQAKVSKAKSRIPPPKFKLTGGNKINGLISAEKSNQRSTLETPEEGEEDVKRSTKPVKEVRVLKASEKKRKEKDRLLAATKAALVENMKEKKRNKKKGDAVAVSEPVTKKRVGFA